MGLDETSNSFHTNQSLIGALSPLGFTNTTRSDRLTHLYNKFALYFLNSFQIQSQFLVQNVFRHDFTLLPSDHESHWSIKCSRNPKNNAKRSTQLHTLPCDHESHKSIKSPQTAKHNAKRSI
ncbi:uncharacterized protein G2W53_007601 [Senna tora]|uniref:Uncharacterized protein n=1 Tax=Senna tora TaxID=362788 RepID=A0A834X7J9_9FABA|nr:uncharacterized protein G2W53_007601 [Senna tora]